MLWYSLSTDDDDNIERYRHCDGGQIIALYTHKVCSWTDEGIVPLIRYRHT